MDGPWRDFLSIVPLAVPIKERLVWVDPLKSAHVARRERRPWFFKAQTAGGCGGKFSCLRPFGLGARGDAQGRPGSCQRLAGFVPSASAAFARVFILVSSPARASFGRRVYCCFRGAILSRAVAKQIQGGGRRPDPPAVLQLPAHRGLWASSEAWAADKLFFAQFLGACCWVVAREASLSSWCVSGAGRGISGSGGFCVLSELGREGRPAKGRG